jgi:hypothetical protein
MHTSANRSKSSSHFEYAWSAFQENEKWRKERIVRLLSRWTLSFLREVIEWNSILPVHQPIADGRGGAETDVATNCINHDFIKVGHNQGCYIITAIRSNRYYMTVTSIMPFNISSLDKSWSLMTCTVSDCTESSRERSSNELHLMEGLRYWNALLQLWRNNDDQNGTPLEWNILGHNLISRRWRIYCSIE